MKFKIGDIVRPNGIVLGPDIAGEGTEFYDIRKAEIKQFASRAGGVGYPVSYGDQYYISVLDGPKCFVEERIIIAFENELEFWKEMKVRKTEDILNDWI